MPETQADLYLNIYRTSSAYASRLLSNPAEAAEVTYKVFLKMHQALPTLQHPEKLATWLRRIVFTTVMDYYRARQKRQPLPAADPADEPTTGSAGQEAVLTCIARLLTLLPAEQRALLDAVEVRGISQVQYARQHGLPLSTVKSRVQRARQQLRNQLTGNCLLTTDGYGQVVDYVLPAGLAN